MITPWYVAFGRSLGKHHAVEKEPLFSPLLECALLGVSSDPPWNPGGHVTTRDIKRMPPIICRLDASGAQEEVGAITFYLPASHTPRFRRLFVNADTLRRRSTGWCSSGDGVGRGRRP